MMIAAEYLKQLGIYVFVMTIIVPPLMLLLGFWLGRKGLDPVVIDTRGEIREAPKPEKALRPHMEQEPVDRALRGKKPYKVA